MPQYDRMSDEKKLEYFLKLEPELVIDPTKRQEIRIDMLENEKSELEKTKSKVDYLVKLIADKGGLPIEFFKMEENKEYQNILRKLKSGEIKDSEN